MSSPHKDSPKDGGKKKTNTTTKSVEDNNNKPSVDGTEVSKEITQSPSANSGGKDAGTGKNGGRKTPEVVDVKAKEDKEEQAKNNAITTLIKRQTGKRYYQEKFPYKSADVVKVLMMVKDQLQSESNLVECILPCVIVGDIHGQYGDLMRAFQFFNTPKSPGYANQRFVFLGDYVDRGKMSLECIMLVFLLKLKYRGSIVLLRGNHETSAINQAYGFHDELVERFKEQGESLWEMFNECFAYLPLACLIGKTILAMHGGLSEELHSLDDIRKIPRPLLDPNDNKLATDLLWSDPMIDLKGFIPNEVRGASVNFGENVVHETLQKLGLTLIIRAHQMMMNGFNFFADRKMVTIFTAPAYHAARENRGAIAYIDSKGRMGFKLLIPIKGADHGAEVFRGKHDNDNKEHPGYLKKMP